MTKQIVDIDDELLDEARRALGTSTIKDTVNSALVETASAARRRAITAEDLQRFAEAARDLADPEVMARAWQ